MQEHVKHLHIPVKIYCTDERLMISSLNTALVKYEEDGENDVRA